MRFALTLTVKNGALYEAMQAKGMTSRAFAEAVGVGIQTVSHWLNLKASPKHPDVRVKIHAVLGVSCDMLFPREELRAWRQLGAPQKRTIMKECSPHQLQATLAARAMLPSPEQQVIEQDARVMLHAILIKACQRLEKRRVLSAEKLYDIVARRFGLREHDEQTLEEIAVVYDVSRERIRQIIATILHEVRKISERMPGIRQDVYDVLSARERLVPGDDDILGVEYSAFGVEDMPDAS